MDWLLAHFAEAVTWFRTTHPAFLLAAIAFLPLVGVPVSPFLILSGVRFGPLWGTVAASGALFVNAALGYWLASTGLRPLIERWLARRGRSVPPLPKGDEWRFILLCRLTPGFPLPLQNYVLGCARVHFGRYLLLSFPTQLAYAAAFAYFGDSLAESNVWRTGVAVCLLIAMALLVSLIRRWSRSRLRPAQPNATEAAKRDTGET